MKFISKTFATAALALAVSTATPALTTSALVIGVTAGFTAFSASTAEAGGGKRISQSSRQVSGLDLGSGR